MNNEELSVLLDSVIYKSMIRKSDGKKNRIRSHFTVEEILFSVFHIYLLHRSLSDEYRNLGVFLFRMLIVAELSTPLDFMAPSYCLYKIYPILCQCFPLHAQVD